MQVNVEACVEVEQQISKESTARKLSELQASAV